MIPSPRDLDLPHDEWREHQCESYLWLKQNLENRRKFSILDSPVGCGKSATVTALTADSRILTLVSTLGLGQQYAREYDYFFLPGRQEHLCIDPKRIADLAPTIPTAFDCHLPRMEDCGYDCPYLEARNQAILARKVVITYKYAALARWPKDRGGVLVCDEAHGLAEELLALSKFEITQWQVEQFDLPSISEGFPIQLQGIVTDEVFQKVLDYLALCYKATICDEQDIRRWRFHKHVGDFMLHKLSSETSWFIDAGNDVSVIYRKGKRKLAPGLLLRPLDARSIASSLWKHKRMTVLMSATIGEPKPLAKELGIDKFEHRAVPHVIPVDKRPVYTIFKDRMTKENLAKHPGLYAGQAAAISHWINNEIPEDWRGIILTTSYVKIKELREHLDIGSRLWEPPSGGVTKRIEAFLSDPRPGIVSVDTLAGWGHGLDLRGDLGRFVVVAGVQHANPADPYDMARKARPGGGKYLVWLAHCGTMQACGRVTRGTFDENGEYLLNVAALADGCALTRPAKRTYSDWFLEAMK